jgi:hypothetical protein
MSACKGLHCPGCGDSGPGTAIAALVIVGLVVFAVFRRAIDHAVDDLVRLLEIMVLAFASAAVLAGAGLTVYLCARASARVRARARERVVLGAPVQVSAVETLSEPRAIESAGLPTITGVARQPAGTLSDRTRS